MTEIAMTRSGQTHSKSRRSYGAPAQRLVRTVALVGLMGSGKSSVGNKLSNLFQVGFTDADDEIQKAANLSIAEIFATYGEAEFRALERRVLERLTREEPQVVATGGGAFMDPATRAALTERAVTVWLRADLDLLVKRTAGRTHRPLLNAGDPRQILSDLIDKRYPVYAQADVTVQSEDGMTHDQMARRIKKALNRHGGVLAQRVV